MSHRRRRGSDLPESDIIEAFNQCGYCQSRLKVRIHLFISEMKLTPRCKM
jgi:hypothetical protein